MTTDIDEGWIRETIKAKSDQLNAVDLVAGPITVKVEAVSKGAADQPVIMKISGGHQPYKPCKSMRRVLIYCWGDKPSLWIGRSMTLYCDAKVKWAGEEVGGIRISHLSNIDAAKTVQLNETRGKKVKVTIQPLFEPWAKVEEAIKQDDVVVRMRRVLTALGDAKSLDDIDKIRKNASKLYATLNDEQKSVIDEAESIAKERCK